MAPKEQLSTMKLWTICPVSTLARRVANLQSSTNMCTLDTVYHASGRKTTVTDCDIGIAVRWGTTYDGLMTKGYTLTRISSHSLRAGGAMAMKLSGASDSTIMQVGQWMSLTYLTYIHTQIGALTSGLAWCMSTAFTFQTLGRMAAHATYPSGLACRSPL
jgi:hypothetical protein